MHRRLQPHLLVAAVVLLGSLLAPPAQAQDESDQPAGIRLEAEAGYDNLYLVGRRVPVVVSIEADRLVRGVVEVSIEGQPGTWSVPVEVPGGSDKQVVVVVPTPFSFPIDSLRVRLVGDGDPVAIEAELEPLESEELVGLLPGVTPADRPPPFPFPQEVGTARFVEIDADTLALGGAIDPLGTLVAGTEELGALDGGTRALVLDWVDRGGRLVVDAGAGTPIAGLPEAWQPGPTGRAPAGLGEVRLGGGRAAAGDWAAVVEPTPTVSVAETSALGGMITTGVEAVGDSVARDAGLDDLELPWLLGFLAAYVLLAGPAGYFFIRRRRPTLGWVVIPGLAVTFTGLAFVVGADLREGNRAAHGTVLEVGPAGTRATTVVGTVSRTGGDGTVDFPSGWTAGGVDTFNFGPGAGGAAELAISTTGSGAEGRIPLAAGGFGVIRGAGLAPSQGEGLTITATSEGGAVVGTVRNDLPFGLEEVGLFLGRSAQRLDSIGPGESVDFEIVGGEFRLGDIFTPAEAEVWPQQANFERPPEFDGVVNLSLLNEAFLALGPNARPRGVVTVVGWSRSVPSPVDVAGQQAPEGRSAVVARAPVTAGADAGVALGAARREIVRGPEGIDLPDDDELGRGLQGALWRFTLPAGSAAGPLEVQIPRYVRRLDVWDGTAWQVVDVDPQEIDDRNFDGDVSRLRTAVIPQIGRQGDVIWVRGFLFTDFGAADGAGLDVRSAEGAPPP